MRQRRQFLGLLASAPATSLLPRVAQGAESVSTEGLLVRVREGLTPEVFDGIEPLMVRRVGLEAGLCLLNEDVGLAFGSVEDVCAAGDPWVDGLAWCVTWALAVYVLSGDPGNESLRGVFRNARAEMRWAKAGLMEIVDRDGAPAGST